MLTQAWSRSGFEQQITTRTTISSPKRTTCMSHARCWGSRGELVAHIHSGLWLAWFWLLATLSVRFWVRFVAVCIVLPIQQGLTGGEGTRHLLTFRTCSVAPLNELLPSRIYAHACCGPRPACQIATTLWCESICAATRGFSVRMYRRLCMCVPCAHVHGVVFGVLPEAGSWRAPKLQLAVFDECEHYVQCHWP